MVRGATLTESFPFVYRILQTYISDCFHQERLQVFEEAHVALPNIL